MHVVTDICVAHVTGVQTFSLPICTVAHHPLTAELIEEVARRVEQRGVDAWFELDPAELLGDEADDYLKVDDTLDVWFDSGVTHYAVLDQRPELGRPADLYLEGSDQRSEERRVGTGCRGQGTT